MQKWLFFLLISFCMPSCLMHATRSELLNHISQAKDTGIQFVIVIPSYNNKRWYKRNLDSVFNQKYAHYRVIYIDDCSPDGTGELVRQYITALGLQDRVTLICNKKRVKAMANIYKAVHLCKDNEIIVMLDGDDYLAHDEVLDVLVRAYTNPNVWLTFGSFIWCINGVHHAGWAVNIPSIVVQKNAFRFYKMGPPHLRTFYAQLFKKIKKEDLGENGEFYEYTYDLAMMFPMIEMAGDRFKFIPQNLYVYNDENDLNDHKIGKVKQRMTDLKIRAKEPYKRIDVLFDN